MDDTEVLQRNTRIMLQPDGTVKEIEVPFVETLHVRPEGAKVIITEEKADQVRALDYDKDRIPREAAEKPTAEETPYRSRYFVSALESADGNSYKPGEPIPLIEAARQGQGEEAVRAPESSGLFMPCPGCDGIGKSRYVPGHRKDCGCGGCEQCAQCNGFGQIRTPVKIE